MTFNIFNTSILSFDAVGKLFQFCSSRIFLYLNHENMQGNHSKFYFQMYFSLDFICISAAFWCILFCLFPVGLLQFKMNIFFVSCDSSLNVFLLLFDIFISFLMGLLCKCVFVCLCKRFCAVQGFSLTCSHLR